MKKNFTIVVSFFLILFLAFPVLAADRTAMEEVMTNLERNQGKKAKILWYDLSANIENLDTPDKVREIVEKTTDANIDTIILDVKNYTGNVGYISEIAPHMSNSSIPEYQKFPEGYDLLEEVIKAAHEKGIDVHANVNVFSEGNNQYQDGPAFQNPDWQSIFYMEVRLAEAENGSLYEITGINKTRGVNELVLYTPSQYDKTPTNQWGAEVQIIDGEVVKIVDRINGAPPLDIPENGMVLSGHGEAREWILSNLKPGQTIDLSKGETKLVPASEYPTFSTFVNPIREDVQTYELSIIQEIIENYDVDGIVLDRARYSNIHADFSDLSRDKFEEYIGETVENWPEDIYKITFTGESQQIVPGPLYQKWIEWRAGNIQSFFKKAEQLVHSHDSDLFFSTYVGSWYPLYFSEGVNWASNTYQPDYDWASPDYHKTGYAETLDFLMTGNYFSEVTREEAVEVGNPDWYSVEGSVDIAMDVVNEATFLYGSLYLLQYENNPEQFRKALRTVMDNAHGIMLFDLVYLEEYGWWYILEEEFKNPSKPPHKIPGLLKMIRQDQ
ncbi:glycosyl hydrolase family 10 [Melghiribacillus thermohalophilus]|uniref:Glycosyl hydrolase family 10 n=1 Tax=Melghiribacillus thermohalophilus TaxID=1324956 RepID=A0A4R3MYK3_9BACI|nr:alpha amylase family protein [Melghiribacillus thermohalophilus]TCT21748.1 glycosyl hydrolase family 10 [Melghiribacillus thermohalophilus]